MRIQSPEAAVKAYGQAYELGSSDASLAWKRAKAFTSNHDYQRATKFASSALKAHPECSSLRFFLAELGVRLNQYEYAAKVFAELVHLIHNSCRCWLSRQSLAVTQQLVP